jgi:hemolysin activation/secretion protein
VEDHLPFHGSVEVNNQHNQGTTALRAVASASYDNLWQLGHSINLSYRVAPERPDDGQVISATYIARVPRTPLSLLAYGVRSDSNVSAVGDTTIIGKGTIFGTRAIFALPGTEGFYQSFTAGFDRKSLTQNVVTGGAESDSPVLYYPVSLAYAATLEDGEGTTRADASLNFAIPGLSDDSAFLDSQRFDATAQYLYLKANLSRTQSAPFGTVAVARLEGQITNDPLLSSEQFSVGGAQSVRGYLEAERLGDYGVLASLELRSPSFGQDVSPRINEWRAIAFTDGAKVWRTHALPEEKFVFGLAGLGIGTRITAYDVVNAVVDVAFPLVDGAVTKAGTPRAHLRLWSEF